MGAGLFPFFCCTTSKETAGIKANISVHTSEKQERDKRQQTWNSHNKKAGRALRPHSRYI